MPRAVPAPKSAGSSEARSIHHVLRQWAELTPQAVAIAAPGRAALTYRRLFAHVKSVVEALNAAGIGRGDRVIVALPNGPEMATAFVAVAAGATCVPVNPAYRVTELASHIASLGAKASIVQAGTDSAARAAARSLGVRILELSPIPDAEAGLFILAGDGHTRAARTGFAEPGDAALVLLTSGTTSRPKVVSLTHANLSASADNIRAALELTAADRCLNVMPLFHIHGLAGAVLSSLAAGASVFCAPDFYAPKFLEWMEEFRPTWYTAAPAIHQAILERAASHREVVQRSPLRFIRSCSAPLRVALMAELERKFKAPVIEAYGMTEAAHQIASNPLDRRKAGSVGVAAGPEVAILDEAGDRLPVGQVGEIAIRGANVIQGYDGAAEIDREAFTHGWLRTGDLGYLDGDGYLFITGRLKEIVNRGGEKISPEEIEEALLAHPAVAEAAAFAVFHVTLGEEVAAAVVLREDGAPTEQEIRDFVAERLSDFKVPKRVVVVRELPKTASGKIRRRDLAEQLRLTAEVRAEPSAAYAPPVTPTEKGLVEIWSEVLGIAPIGIHDNFFMLGGDSLRAGQVLSRLRESAQVEISFVSFFATPSVAGLGKAVEAARQGAPDATAPIRRAPRDETPPLSFTQERMWFLEQLAPGNPVYHRSLLFRVAGPLDTAALNESLNGIIRRHAILRTTFGSSGGQPYQVILPNQDTPIHVVDLTTLPEKERRPEAERFAAVEAKRPFDLGNGPLLRAIVLRLGDEERLLVLAMHHMVFDGWSDAVFLRELSALYETFRQGKAPSLPELPIQYADFAVWQREWLQGEVLERQLSYWKRQLSAVPVLELPADRPRPAIQTFRGAAQSFTLPEALSDELKALGRREGTTLFMTLLAAFQTLLHRYTGQDDIAVGSPIAGRTRAEFEGLIGLFINTLVLRDDLSGDPKFKELMGRVRDATLAAYQHQELPFEKLVEGLRPERDPSRSPLFQVMFVLQNMPRTSLELPGLTVTPLEGDSGTAKFDLTLSMAEAAGSLRATLEYNTDLFDHGTIERMIGHFQTLLEGIVANPDQRLSELPILTEAERHQLLVEWNDTKRDYPKDKCIHELFEEQAERSPDAAAAVFEDTQLTYRELNRRANQLARYLQRFGVGPETLVGLYVKRSLEMVVGLLGILKAGGAYVPLDASYPTKRLAFMLQDAHIVVLLTQRRLVEGLSKDGVHTICLDTDWQAIARESDANPVSCAKGDNLAYVIYTSGSTGTPKGVLVEHRQILNYVKGVSDRLNLELGASFAMVQPLSVDSSQTAIFPALISGGCLHVVSEERASDRHALGEYFRRFAIDLLKIAPSHLAALQLSLRPEQLLPRRWLVLGGEASRRDWVEKLQATTSCSIFNHYGPTEATVGALTYAMGKERNGHSCSTLPIGRPIPNIQAYVLDRHLQPVPIGVAGELHIGGSGLTRGYLNRPELTRERFIPNPFSNEPGTRLYKTGDLARYLPDGNIEFLGRADHQVKIRGFRVELGEIEAVLGQHPDVRDVAVLAREDSSGRQRLVAYIVANKKRAPTIGGRQRYRLPNHMAVAQLNNYETDYIYEEIFERQAYLKHGIAIREGDYVFDVGANIGLFTIFVRQMCKTARVYAFEPNPFAFEILNLNASLYAPGAKLFDCGLSNETKTASFTFFPGFSLFSGFYADPQVEKEVVKTFMLNQQKAGKAHMAELLEQADGILDERFSPTTLSVRSRTLSAVMEEEGVECIDLLKINAEKSELDVLNGINDVDWKKIKQIVLEVDVEENLRAILSLLERQGYDFIVEQDRLLENTQLRYVYAIRPSEGKRLERNAERAEIVPMLSDSLLSPDELRRFLRERVPEYMVPSALVFLQALPLTPHGKVDRRALPAPEQARPFDGAQGRPELENSYIAPRTEVENALAVIWAEVFKLDQVGIHDNFFDLGGHSLLATQVISRLREAFHVETPLRALFESPTVAGLAEQVEKAGLAGPEPQPGSGDGEAPLSFAQQRLWFLHQLDPGSPVYNVARVMRLSGALHVEALQKSLSVIVARHEILRTRITAADGRLRQIVTEGRPVQLAAIDLSERPRDQREGKMHRLLAGEIRRPFDLTSDLSFRVTLLRLSEEQHVLALAIHHIFFDGWSEATLLRELSALYDAFSQGKVPSLPELSIQYADFAVWQRQRLQGKVLEEQISYWKKRLEGIPVLELFTDRPRPAVQSYRGARQSFVLPKALSDGLKALSRREGVTLFMTLLAAFQALLQRYTGQNDIAIGSPIAGRTRAEFEETIGLFINTLVLRGDLSGHPKFTELLARARKTALEAYEHQELPFEKLVEELHPERDPSRSPLFQVMFAFENMPRASRELTGLRVSPIKVHTGTAKFDLTLSIEEEAGVLAAALEFNTDLFDHGTIERMIGHFQTLLDGIVANPNERLSELPLLSEAERRQLLVEWNDTARDFPKDKKIQRLFEKQADRTPDAVAVVFPSMGSGHSEDSKLTYLELNRRANQLAHRLRKLGVGPEARVGLYMERSLETVVGLLAILKAGGVYVPLEPAYPDARIGFMIEDAQLSVLLTQSSLSKRFSGSGVHVVCVDGVEELVPEREKNPACEVKADNAAYVIYTSGSTGEPKGVVVTHSSLAQHCLEIQRYYELRPEDRVLQFASLSFDVSLEQVLPALISGATLFMRGAETWSAEEFYEKASELRLTAANLPTAYWHQCVQALADAPGLPAAHDLRLMIVGGEAMSPLSLKLWRQTAMKGVRLLNAYGPTETTITATTFEIQPELSEADLHSVPIGRPLGNRKTYVLDKHQNPVPIGVAGELHIGGSCLARGYLNRPELTAEKFIPDPFSDQPGARLYKTGDLARYLPDGNIEFLGRLDDQVKIRGYRIEPGEIESVLARHPGVHDAVVLARDDTPADILASLRMEKRLVAYVVPGRELSPSVGELRSFLKEKLPPHMVPSAFVILDALPLTPNGKLDRRALPAPEQTRPELENSYIAPRTEVENVLAAIWAEVLKLDQVGIHDNFFDLGGHSLLAIQVVSRVRDALQVELPLRSFFETPTVAGLAATIQQAKDGGVASASPKITPVPRRSCGMNSPL